MPYKIDWYVPERVFFIEIYGEMTLTEIEDVVIDSKMFNQSANQLVHSFTNLARMKSVPTNLKTAVDAVRNAGFKVNNLGWVVIISQTNPLLSFLVSTLGQMFGFRFRIVNTLEEALAFLNEQDASLPALEPIYDVYVQACQRIDAGLKP